MGNVLKRQNPIKGQKAAENPAPGGGLQLTSKPYGLVH